MSKQEKNAYILGTERAELHRLGLQHQVWAAEARKGWALADFSVGQTILDLGCGPGFCTLDLAYIAGQEGKVIGVDKSESYIEFLKQSAKQHQLDIELHACDFDEMNLPDNSLDSVYCRWALAWLPNPEEIIAKVVKAMRPGGAFVVHEYFDWSIFQCEPHLPALQQAISAAYKSFDDSSGNINIGRKLPDIFYDNGLEVIGVRPMSVIARPDELSWEWPRSFLEIYLPKLVPMGFLTKDVMEQALEELEDLGDMQGASILCPHMVEVIGIKV